MTSDETGFRRHDDAFRRENLGRLLIRAFNAFESHEVNRLREGGFADFQPSDTRILVTTAPDPEDGRARVVHLTERGLELIARGQRMTHELYERWAAVLGRDDLDRLKALLERLVYGLDPDDDGLG